MKNRKIKVIKPKKEVIERITEVTETFVTETTINFRDEANRIKMEIDKKKTISKQEVVKILFGE